MIKKKAKSILIFFLCLIIASFIYYFIGIRDNDLVELSLGDFNILSSINIENSSMILTTTDNDAWMEVEFDNPLELRSANILLNQPTGFDWNLQIFYADNDNVFSEDCSKKCLVKANQRDIFVSFPETKIQKVRIDFGDESGKSYSVNKILLNSNSRSFKVFFIPIVTIIIFSFFKILFMWINDNEISDKIRTKNIIWKSFAIVVATGLAITWLRGLYFGFNIFETLFVQNDNMGKGISLTFTSINFLFVFLPLSVAGYYLFRNNLRYIFLVFVSVLFYAAGEPVMVWLLLLSVFVNYVFGLLLSSEKRIIKISFLILMLFWNFGLLYYYKYYVFTLETFNSLFGSNYIIPKIIQPLGISFFTFRTVSFCLDVYWGTVPAQYNFWEVILYICFFPQVSMGPISKYNDFSLQLKDRSFDVDKFLNGIKRIIIGLSKKLIISNNIGGTVDLIFAMEGSQRSVVLSWIGIFSYLIQLYYDFSGYSDIAIGIGQLLGFDSPENFRYPFVSKSVVEYWSRWHITLGTWLKNYLYMPIFRTCQNRNISVGVCNLLALLGVWVFAGVWHGAGWNYVCYGLYYFAFIMMERLWEDYKKKRRKKLKIKKKPEKLGQKISSHLYFFVVLIFGQLLFRSVDLIHFGEFIKSMFGLNGNGFCDSTTIFYWKQISVLFFIGWFFALPIIEKIKMLINGKAKEWIIDIASLLIYPVLLIISLAFAMTDTYQSFIYFQF